MKIAPVSNSIKIAAVYNTCALTWKYTTSPKKESSTLNSTFVTKLLTPCFTLKSFDFWENLLPHGFYAFLALVTSKLINYICHEFDILNILWSCRFRIFVEPLKLKGTFILAWLFNFKLKRYQKKCSRFFFRGRCCKKKMKGCKSFMNVLSSVII